LIYRQQPLGVKFRLGQNQQAKPCLQLDGMIAATGIVNNLIIATRNTSDMEISGASLLDPWLPVH